MKKLWSYIAIFFVGLSAGLLVAVKAAGDEYKAHIGKIKQKGRDNTLDSKLDVNIEPNRAGRRKNRRIERRKLKAYKKLDKLT